MRFASSLASLFRFAPVIAPVALLPFLCALPQAAHAQTTVNYYDKGTFTSGNTYTTGGITATSTGTIQVTGNVGVGVVGGRNDVIDSGESVLFTFDSGPATSVGLVGGVSRNFTVDPTVEIFGIGGGSLGVFSAFDIGFSSNNLSLKVNNAAISGFRLSGGTGISNNVYAAQVTYTPAAINAVPEPGEWATMGMASAGLCGLMVRARRKKAGQSATVAA